MLWNWDFDYWKSKPNNLEMKDANLEWPVLGMSLETDLCTFYNKLNLSLQSVTLNFTIHRKNSSRPFIMLYFAGSQTVTLFVAKPCLHFSFCHFLISIWSSIDYYYYKSA